MIEKFWDDIVVYSVEYKILMNDNTLQVQHKTLACNSLIIEKELENKIKNHLTNCIEVTFIEEIADGLFLKEKYSDSSL